MAGAVTLNSFEVSIRQWCAWAPGYMEEEDWHRWIAMGSPPIAEEGAPDVSFLPAMLRRRCSTPTKIALSLVQRITNTRPHPAPFSQVIFASRYGEAATTISLLDQLVKREDLSPTAFSLSVHNTAAGQYSIIHQDRSATLSLSAGPATLCYALLEAHLFLLQRPERDVLVVFSEEALPEGCREFCDSPQLPYGIGLVVSAREGKRIKLSRLKESGEGKLYPANLDLIPLLLGKISSFGIASGRTSWRIEGA